MRVLIACESSGVSREAWRKLGHNAWSCDLLPAEDGSQYHIQGSVLDILEGIETGTFQGESFEDLSGLDQEKVNLGIIDEDLEEWDLMIAHPPCTYLTNSAEWAYGDGPYHQKVKAGTLVGLERREARHKAIDFVYKLMRAQIGMIAIENPIGALSSRIKPPSQYIQPYEYGDDASKKTCLWLKGLPILKKTTQYPARMVEWPKGSEKIVKRWGNQTDSGQNRLSPGADRWKIRSKTYQGWADAMAQQWGNL